MKRKLKPTYEEFSENKKQKRLLNREYRDLLISELLLAAMEEDHISVRKLAIKKLGAAGRIQIQKLGRI